MSKATSKTPQKTPLRKPKHGRGALRVGGTNKGGTGRPPNKLRVSMRQALADRMDIACEMVDDTTLTTGDRLRALEFLAKYGLGPRNTTQRIQTQGESTVTVRFAHE